jgi:hypothetical protein
VETMTEFFSCELSAEKENYENFSFLYHNDNNNDNDAVAKGNFVN